MKNVFWLVIVSLGLATFCADLWAYNQAARWLAEKVYADVGHRIRTKQWSKVLAALELIAWLDPSYPKAREGKTEWEARLKNRAERKYQMGLRAYQSRKFAEAKIHWQEAKQILGECEDPLQTKLDSGLKLLLNGGVVLKVSEQTQSEPAQPGLAQKMVAVSELLAAGESEQARLTLAELIHQDPKNERAKKLLESLSQQEVKPTNEKTGKIYKETELLFEEGKKLEAQKQSRSAYPDYAKAYGLLSAEPFKPYFFAELTERKENLEDRIRKTMKPKLEMWRRRFAQRVKVPGTFLKTLATELRKILHDYPFLNEAKELLAKVYRSLDERARPFLIEAKTLQELEGCKVSGAKFEKVKEIAVFPEVPAWAEAEKNLQACGGRKRRD